MSEYECLKCHNPKTRSEMKHVQDSKPLICIPCADKLRVENRAERRRISEATMAVRNQQEAERECKRQTDSEALSVRATIATRANDKSCMLDVDHVLAKLADARVIAGLTL